MKKTVKTRGQKHQGENCGKKQPSFAFHGSLLIENRYGATALGGTLSNRIGDFPSRASSVGWKKRCWGLSVVKVVTVGRYGVKLQSKAKSQIIDIFYAKKIFLSIQKDMKKKPALTYGLQLKGNDIPVYSLKK